MSISSVNEFINSLKADIGKTASDLDLFNKMGVSADNWCVDYGQYKFKQYGIQDYLYNKSARDVGTVSQAFFDKGRLLSREKEPKVGDILIVTNSPNSTSWRSEKYGFYMPELDHFTIITDLSKNNESNGYVIGAIGGNQGNNNINYSKVGFTWWAFNRQAVYCSVDWDSILKGGSSKNKIIVKTEEWLRVLGHEEKTNYENREGQVRNLQRILRECGYKGKDGKLLTVDGVFGDNTEYALKAWQTKHGLTADGVFKEVDQDVFYSTDTY